MNPCDNSITSDQNCSKQLLFAQVNSIIRFLNASTFYGLLTPCTNFGVWLYNTGVGPPVVDVAAVPSQAATNADANAAGVGMQHVERLIPIQGKGGMLRIFTGMFDCGIHRRLDVLIEGQKEADDKLEGIKETLQEILEKVEIRYPNGVAHA